MGSGISVVIPTIITRDLLVGRAVASAARQTLQPEAIIVVPDSGPYGAAWTRTRGLEQVRTEWVAFLDDDDEMNVDHLEKLHAHAIATESDFVFSWFTVMGGTDPFPANEHREFDPEDPHQTTVTVLVRTEAAVAVGGFEDGIDGDPGTDTQGNRAGEEFRFAKRIAAAGYKIGKLHERTWTWHHHQHRGGNTSGLPENIGQ
jgi:glycosyltransferase involved in cell wall biosynthesis